MVQRTIRPPKPPPRPSSPQIGVRIPEDLLRRVDAHAQERRITRSIAVRELLAAALGLDAAEARL